MRSASWNISVMKKLLLNNLSYESSLSDNDNDSDDDYNMIVIVWNLT